MKAFLETKVDKSEVVVQWVHCAHRGECRMLQMHPVPFKAKTVQPTGSVQPSQQDQSYRLVHHSPVFPQGMGDNKVQGCSISKDTLPLTFSFFSRRMNSLKGILLLKPSCLALSTHAFWQSLVLCTLCVYCAMLSLHVLWKSQSLNRWGEVFLVRLSYMVTTQMRNAGIWDPSGKTLLEDLQGVLYLAKAYHPQGLEESKFLPGL